MDLSDLVSRLTLLGLDEDEAHVYLRLVQQGPSKASDLTPYFEMSRSKLYRVLDDLAEKGYLTKSMERPTMFDPVDPMEAFRVAIDRLSTRQNQLHRLAEELEDPLADLESTGSEESSENWQLVEGVDRIYDRIHDATVRAEESLWLASNDAMSLRTDVPAIEEIWHLVAERAEDGLQTRLLLDVQAQDEDRVPDWLPNDALKFRTFEASEPVHFLLLDGHQVILWARTSSLEGPQETDPVAVWTDAPGVVASQRLLFRTLWSTATPYREQGAPSPRDSSR